MHHSSNTTTKHYTSVIVIMQFAQSVCTVLCLLSVYILCTTNKNHGSKCVDTIYVFTDVYMHVCKPLLHSSSLATTSLA